MELDTQLNAIELKTSAIGKNSWQLKEDVKSANLITVLNSDFEQVSQFYKEFDERLYLPVLLCCGDHILQFIHDDQSDPVIEADDLDLCHQRAGR